MAICKFENKNDIVRAFAIFAMCKAKGLDLDTEFQKAFTKDSWELARDTVLNNIGTPGEKHFSSQENPVVNITTTGFQQIGGEENIASYFEYSNNFIKMELMFQREMLKSCVVDLEKAVYLYPDSKVDGISVLQRGILEYKIRLIKDIFNSIGETFVNPITYKSSDEDLTNIEKTTIEKYENWLETHKTDKTETLDSYISYVILKNFDNLAKLYTPYVGIKSSYKTLDGIQKYDFVPTVKHRNSWSKTENSDASHLVGKLAESILKVLPDLDENLNPVGNSTVGVSGFNSVTQMLKQAVMLTNMFGEDSANFRKSFLGGVSSLLDSTNPYNLNNLIERFISLNKQAGFNSLNKFRQTYLHNKLRSLQHYIFSNKTPNDIKNIFALMLLKTEATEYRAYTISDNKMFEGIKLSTRSYSSQRYAIQNVISGGLKSLFVKNRISASKFLDLYYIQDHSTDGINRITLTSKESGKTCIITWSGNIDSAILETGDNSIVNELMLDGYSYYVPDTYDTCISNTNENYNWANDFAPFIAAAVRTSQYICGQIETPGITISEAEIPFDQFKSSIEHISERLSVIFGDSIKSTIKSLGGNSLPLYGLTSLEYNWKNCLDDARKLDVANDPNITNSQRFNLLWTDEDIISSISVRGEIEMNGQIKESTKLNVNELARVSILDDFWFPSRNNNAEDSIFLQNATFSDKARHFLVGYKLNTKLNNPIVNKIWGKTMSLKEIIDESISSEKGKENFVEFIREIRRDKYAASVRKVLLKYAKAFQEINIDINSINYLNGEEESAKACAIELRKVDNWLRTHNISIEEIKKKFRGVRENFEEEVDAYSPKNSDQFGESRINETMLHYITVASDKNNWKEFIQFNENKFAGNISSLVLSRYDKGSGRQVTSLVRDITLNSRLGSKLNSYYDSTSGEYKFVSTNGELHPIAEAYFLTDILLSQEMNSLTVKEIWAHPNKNKELGSYSYSQNPVSFKENFEVSSQGDTRFSAHYATFKPGTILFGQNVGGRTIESVYQHGVKQNDWVTNNNSKTGKPTSDLIIKNINDPTEESTYYNGYLPLWEEWARQNPQEIRWLKEHLKNGTVLTDKFATTSVSQARALADILNNEVYLEYSEASRLVNQIKRSVIFGSTIHAFGQGVKNNEGLECGVTEKLKIAIIDDLDGFFYTPGGVDGKVDAEDGSGRCTALQARLENNSLGDAAVGDNKKTIIHDVDPTTGTPVLLKWAVYAITNSVRRSAAGSNTNAENLLKKMYSIAFDGSNINFKELLNNYYNSGNDPIYIKDRISLTYGKLVDIVVNGDEITQIIEDEITHQTSRKVVKTNPLLSFTLYDIDQVFGGAWTFRKNGEAYIGSEASVDLLVDATIKYNLRDYQIGYAVNKSACKVGATNTNNSSTWQNNTPLDFFEINTKYGGVMMNADHELDEAEVTEMSQMISSLIEGGHYTNLALDIYQEIGTIALNNKKIKPYLEATSGEITPEKLRKMRDLIGKSLIRSFSSGSKDVIGLAQAFVKKAMAEQKANNGSLEINLPLNDETIWGAVIADINSTLTRIGIKRKYEGFAGVLNPSHDLIQYFNVGEDHMLFPQFEEYCKNKLSENNLVRIEGDIIYTGDIAADGTLIGYNNWVEVAQKAIIMANGQTNPFIEEIHTSKVDFEDTIIDPFTGQEIHIDTFKKYDTVKNLNTTVKIHRAKPRNLRGCDTRFTIKTLNGITVGEFSLFDLDSVRASHYLADLKKAKFNVKGEYSPELFKKYNLIKKVLKLNEDLDFNVIKNVDNLVKQCNQITQDILSKLDLGQEEDKLIKDGYLSSPSIDSIISNQERFFGNPDTQYYVSSYYTRPAEIITGRYQMEKLGITATDHIFNIKSAKFFESKLRKKYSKPALNMEDKENNIWDTCLYRNGKKYLVKIGNISDATRSKITLLSCPEVHQVENDLCFEDSIILSEESDNYSNYNFYKLDNGAGEEYVYINVNSKEDLEVLKESSYFDDIYYENNSNGEAIYERLIRRAAKDRFSAYKRGIQYLGARIPTQAMQSYMPFKVVAFIESEQNVVYVPKQNTAIEGSDYDIDKLYLLAATIMDDGKILSGSSLQNELGFSSSLKLFRPLDIEYKVGESGTTITDFMLKKAFNDYQNGDNDNLVFLLNKASKNEFVNFVNTTNSIEFKSNANNFLRMLNKHSHSRNYNTEEALKNRVFSGIYEMTRKSQKQLIMQITVDMCTEELKKKAAQTVSGQAEKLITPYNPMSKFVMQEQNMLGKDVVGIGAVSLKTYFILSSYYNKMANVDLVQAINNAKENLNEENLNIINFLLNKFIIKLPPTGNTSENNISVFSGINFDEPIKAIKELILERGLSPEIESILTTLNKYKALTNTADAPHLLSGVISLAADNAKDLALPKLNATSDLVDVYTTSFMLGIPFSEISDIMTESMFNWMTKAGANNIFDETTLGNKVKDMVDFTLRDNTFLYKSIISKVYTYTNIYNRIHKLPEIVMPTVLNTYGRPVEDLKTLMCNDTFIQRAILAIREQLNKLTHPDGQNEIDVDTIIESDESAEQEWGLRDFYKALKLFEKYRDSLKYIEKDSSTKKQLNYLQDLLQTVEEMSTLGRWGKINQGLPTGLKEFRDFGLTIEDFVNDRWKKMVDPKANKAFSFQEYLINEEYRKIWIQETDKIFKNFNILAALEASPNFFAMSRIYPIARTLLIYNESIYRDTDKIASEINGNKDFIKGKLTKDDFKQITSYLRDKCIYNFLTQSKLSLDLNAIRRDCRSSVEIYEIPNLATTTNIKSLQIITANDVASLKHIIESNIIPSLKAKYRDNKFLRTLAVGDNKNINSDSFGFPFDMMNIDKDANISNLYSECLKGFNTIAGEIIGGKTVGEWFFLYNLIVNKNGYGKRSLTRIFEDLVASPNMPKIITEYYTYLGFINNTSINYPINEVLRYIATYNPLSRVKGYKYNNPATKDHTFIFAESQGQPILQIKHQYSPIHRISTKTILMEFADAINRKAPDTVVLVNNDEAKELGNFDNIKGFVKNGKIYLNLDAFVGNTGSAVALGVAIHELSHLSLAALKALKPNKYYQLLSLIKNDPEYEEIASRKEYERHVGSDLDEEVLCTKIEKLLANRINKNSDVEILLYNGALLEALQEGIFPNLKNINSVIESNNLEELIEIGTKLMDKGMISKGLQKDFIKLNQKIASLKSFLVFDNNSNFNLKQDC